VKIKFAQLFLSTFTQSSLFTMPRRRFYSIKIKKDTGAQTPASFVPTIDTSLSSNDDE